MPTRVGPLALCRPWRNRLGSRLDPWRRCMRTPLTAALAAVLMAGCASTAAKPEAPRVGNAANAFTADPYPSTYLAIPAPPVLITGATVLTGSGERLDDTDVLLVAGTFFSVTPRPPTRLAEPGRICSAVTPPASAA